MRVMTMMVGAVMAIGSSGCILFDQLLEEDETCGGHDLEDHQEEFYVPDPLVTGGDFYTDSDGVTRRLRWSTTFTNVCAEEHAFVTYDIYFDENLPDVDGSGDASPWPLFTYDTELSISTGHLAGVLDVGLAQWYEPDEPAEFVAGIEMRVGATVPEAQLRPMIHQVKIVGRFSAAP